jgi:UPF0271 protein
LDDDLMPLITSANVCCGAHAGDPSTSFRTIQSAVRHGVQIGAHPGFPDREHFGRRELVQTEQAVLENCLYQVGALAGLARAAGAALSHIKAHGALYNLACRDDHYARPLAQTASLFQVPLLGLPESRLQDISSGRCPFVAEGFADRRYQVDGSLVPRSRPDAFVETADEAVEQVQKLIIEKGVQTICVHGDNPRAVEFVRELQKALTDKGVSIRPFKP